MRMVDLRISTLPTINGEKVVMRILDRNSTVHTLDRLGFSPSDLPRVADMVAKPQGIILATGPTGSGKTTTLYSLLQHDATPDKNYVTIEDPVEYYLDMAGQVLVREKIGLTFPSVLRALLRQDPDVILLGEIRDFETAEVAFPTVWAGIAAAWGIAPEAALTAAETGHLVFGTLHTTGAAKTVDRIVDVFPAGEKEMVRSMLSESLRAVISQTLLKTRDGNGRVAAHEILISTPAVRNLIRENKIAQINSTLQTGQTHGMQTLDQSLQALVRQGVISPDVARSKGQHVDSTFS